MTLLLLTPLAWQVCHLLRLRGLPGVEHYLLTGARYGSISPAPLATPADRRTGGDEA